jgi:beta-glucanase (GH16 family)
MKQKQNAEFVVHPLTFAILALGIGALIGLGSFIATRHAGSGNNGAANSGLSVGGSSDNSSPNIPADSHLIFDATFTGSALNTSVWATCFWYAQNGTGCSHSGVFPEQEWYLPSQDQVSGGALHLVASATRTPGTNAQGQPEIYPCRSGIVTTYPSFHFTYGYVQVVAQLPKNANAWPALWMLPSNSATVLPEIDIMEMFGVRTDRPFLTLHPATGPQDSITVKTADLSSGWHTFGLNWERDSLTWYIDGKAEFTIINDVPSQSMYLLANLAISNAFTPLTLPNSCTATMSIQSVKVWQKDSDEAPSS